MDEARHRPAEEEEVTTVGTPKRLVEILTNRGELPPEWVGAVESVDRALFIPESYEYNGRTLSKTADEDRWKHFVYANVPLVTQLNDGGESDGFQLPTSSSSMPTIMLEMLGLLDVEDGHKVIEIGTGTGYNAAWLCHRQGADKVATIELDPAVSQQARQNLKAAGFSPMVVCGDGLAGIPDAAPFDRLICTCAMREIPYAWVEQVPEGKIVTPWGNGFFSASFVTLDVADGVATGRFSGYPAFMWARQQRPGFGYLSDYLHHRDESTETWTTVDPTVLHQDPDAKFAVAAQVPGMWSIHSDADDGSAEWTLWLLSDDRLSWASVDYVPGKEQFVVEQYGPRRLWDETESAYQWWDDEGRPDRERFGLTVDRQGQRVWLDTPDRVIPGF
ncbi:methyltransferase domain-containing protein [Streptomyces sp. H27-G5]|uniref:methyltransferase domain-containing protein n=1 Tax=Streptomyces sp. H27-G5 TaxID=2996698 RepID=UPI00226E572C|nr:methyltransferase domain-containing protein [Streptomyces sp. H27-G5]MCY0924259.1 methyltransferase domain-containing protein [Streptomyces sp. H27-G5]